MPTRATTDTNPTIDLVHLITNVLGRSVCDGALDQRYASHLVRLQSRKDLVGKTTNLVHEDLVRHGAAIQVHGQLVGAGLVGGANDSFGDFIGRAPSRSAAP